MRKQKKLTDLISQHVNTTSPHPVTGLYRTLGWILKFAAKNVINTWVSPIFMLHHKKTEVAQGSKYAQFEIIYSMFWKIFMDQTYLIWTKHIYLTYQTLLFALNSREDYFYNKLRSYGYLKYLYFATRTIYLQNVSWKLMNNFLPYVLTW